MDPLHPAIARVWYADARTFRYAWMVELHYEAATTVIRTPRLGHDYEQEERAQEGCRSEK